MSPGPRQQPFRSDTDAVEGMPMALMVTMVILAITLPMIFGSLRAYDRSRVEAELVSEIGDFIAAVQLVYVSGPGNSAALDFDAASGAMTGIDYVTFGDAPGGNMSSAVRYKLQGRAESSMAITSPNVPMVSAGEAEFSITSGTHRIVAECISGLFTGNATETYVVLSLSH